MHLGKTKCIKLRMYLLLHFSLEILLFLFQWVQLVRNNMKILQESQYKTTDLLFRKTQKVADSLMYDGPLIMSIAGILYS